MQMKWLLAVSLVCFCFGGMVVLATTTSDPVAAAEAEAEQFVKISHYEPVQKFMVSADRTRLSFEAFGQTWPFDLWLSTVHEGNKEHYHGHLVHDPRVQGAFSLMQHTTTGFILLPNDTLLMELRPDGQGGQALFIHKASHEVYHPSFKIPTCGGILPTPSATEQLINSNTDSGMKGAPRNFTGGILMDQNWVALHTVDATFAILNEVNLVYTAAKLAPFQFQLATKKGIRKTTLTDKQEMLKDLARWIYDGNLDKNYSSVVWLIGRNIGGVAFGRSMCDLVNANRRCSVSGSSSHLYTVRTIAHELGHSRGAAHDFANQCNSTLDVQKGNCQCSLMSYCNPAFTPRGNYFSEKSIREIRAYCE